MSYPNIDATPAPSPTQPEVDAASRQRAFDTLYRALARLVGGIGRDWEHCGQGRVSPFAALPGPCVRA